MKKHSLIRGAFLALALSSQVYAYQISIKNEVDGPLSVHITEGKVTTPRQVRTGEYFTYITSDCYVLTFSVLSGRAIGQSGGVGSDFQRACKDYKIIARFLQSPTIDPGTGKEDLEPKIMEIREE